MDSKIVLNNMIGETNKKKMFQNKTLKLFPSNVENDIELPKNTNKKLLKKMGKYFESLNKVDQQLFLTYYNSYFNSLNNEDL